MHRLIGGLLIAVVLAPSAGTFAQESTVSGNAARGQKLIFAEGCGSCHDIPGIPKADGLVGPPLGNIGSRIMIAGMLPNQPSNMIRWLMSPQSIVPGNAMPDMGLDQRDAADIAAYLETLR